MGMMPVHCDATASACCASARSTELMEIISIDWCCGGGAGNHDHGGDAAEAGKRQAFDQLFVGHDLVSPRLQLAIDALDPERMPECHRFASRPRQDHHPRVGAGS